MTAGRFHRPFVATLLAAATIVAAVLPPAHIHLVAHDDHHHHHGGAIEHSHWSSHAASRASFDDEDGRAIYVDQSAVTAKPAATMERPTSAIVALRPPAVRTTFTIAERRTSGNSPRDGPVAVPPSFRAPPFVL